MRNHDPSVTLAKPENRSIMLWTVLTYANINEQSEFPIADIREAIELEICMTNTSVDLGIRVARKEKLVSLGRTGLRLTTVGEERLAQLDVTFKPNDQQEIYAYPDN